MGWVTITDQGNHNNLKDHLQKVCGDKEENSFVYQFGDSRAVIVTEGAKKSAYFNDLQNRKALPSLKGMFEKDFNFEFIDVYELRKQFIVGATFGNYRSFQGEKSPDAAKIQILNIQNNRPADELLKPKLTNP